MNTTLQEVGEQASRYYAYWREGVGLCLAAGELACETNLEARIAAAQQDFHEQIAVADSVREAKAVVRDAEANGNYFTPLATMKWRERHALGLTALDAVRSNHTKHAVAAMERRKNYENTPTNHAPTFQEATEAYRQLGREHFEAHAGAYWILALREAQDAQVDIIC